MIPSVLQMSVQVSFEWDIKDPYNVYSLFDMGHLMLNAYCIDYVADRLVTLTLKPFSM